MSEDSNDTEGQTLGQAIARIAEGGLPALLLSKPVQQAIGRLVYAASDIPVAKLQQWSQKIRNDTVAQKQLTSVIASKAKALAIEDSDLINRSLENWTHRLGRGQKARENVAAQTLILLAETGVPPQAEAPSEEFMGLFEDVAEKASSEELADLLSRILAGELRKPKSVSRHTLQIAAILDAEIVGALNEVRPYLLPSAYLLTSDWLHIPPSKMQRWDKLLGLLASVSLVTEMQARTITSKGQNTNWLVFGKNALLITCKPAPLGWAVDGVSLTPAGQELISVLPVSDEVSIEEIGQEIYEHYQFVERIQIGILKENGKEVDLHSLRDLYKSSSS